MDIDLVNLIQILIVVAVVFAGVAKAFYKIFVKPFVPTPSGPGSPQPAGTREMREFLDELRRDLGHGDSPPPRTDGLLDREETDSRPAEAGKEPAVEVEVEELTRAPRRSSPQAPPLSVPWPLEEEKAAPARLRRAEDTERLRRSLIAAVAEVRDARAEDHIQAAEPAQASSAPRRDGDLLLGADFGTAMILLEVLGPPRARRRPGRRRIGSRS